MSKRAATFAIAPEARTKRAKYIDARKYLDTEADVDLEGGETEGIEDEDGKSLYIVFVSSEVLIFLCKRLLLYK
jgi:hypothetical protein